MMSEKVEIVQGGGTTSTLETQVNFGLEENKGGTF